MLTILLPRALPISCEWTEIIFQRRPEYGASLYSSWMTARAPGPTNPFRIIIFSVGEMVQQSTYWSYTRRTDDLALLCCCVDLCGQGRAEVLLCSEIIWRTDIQIDSCSVSKPARTRRSTCRRIKEKGDALVPTSTRIACLYLSPILRWSLLLLALNVAVPFAAGSWLTTISQRIAKVGNKYLGKRCSHVKNITERCEEAVKNGILRCCSNNSMTTVLRRDISYLKVGGKLPLSPTPRKVIMNLFFLHM